MPCPSLYSLHILESFEPVTSLAQLYHHHDVFRYALAPAVPYKLLHQRAYCGWPTQQDQDCFFNLLLSYSTLPSSADQGNSVWRTSFWPADMGDAFFLALGGGISTGRLFKKTALLAVSPCLCSSFPSPPLLCFSMYCRKISVHFGVAPCSLNYGAEFVSSCSRPASHHPGILQFPAAAFPLPLAGPVASSCFPQRSWLRT